MQYWESLRCRAIQALSTTTSSAPAAITVLQALPQRQSSPLQPPAPPPPSCSSAPAPSQYSCPVSRAAVKMAAPFLLLVCGPQRKGSIMMAMSTASPAAGLHATRVSEVVCLGDACCALLWQACTAIGCGCQLSKSVNGMNGKGCLHSCTCLQGQLGQMLPVAKPSQINLEWKCQLEKEEMKPCAQF
eukprot:1144446-Pelagomonas_calceolata.AAC.7